MRKQKRLSKPFSDCWQIKWKYQIQVKRIDVFIFIYSNMIYSKQSRVYINPSLCLLNPIFLRLWQLKMISDSCWFFCIPFNRVNRIPWFSFASANTRSIVSFRFGYISFHLSVCLIWLASSLSSSHICLVMTFSWFFDFHNPLYHFCILYILLGSLSHSEDLFHLDRYKYLSIHHRHIHIF